MNNNYNIFITLTQQGKDWDDSSGDFVRTSRPSRANRCRHDDPNSGDQRFNPHKNKETQVIIRNISLLNRI